MIMAGHEFQKFVAYPIARAADQGEAVINWIAERKFRPDHAWRREDWNRAGRLDDFLPQFAEWRFDWLDVPALIQAADAVSNIRWSTGTRSTAGRSAASRLMGDAAHPMYPIGSNGASQGIVDARVLTREIRRCGPTPEALLAYEAERRPATSKIILANRANGPEQVMQLVEQRAPDGFAHIEDVLTAQELESIAAGYKQVAGFDRDALNARGPIV